MESKSINFRGFSNLFILGKHYKYIRRPYYGISFGIPFNIQIRMGAKLISIFNLELRYIYIRSEKLNVIFNNYGDSEEVSEKVNTFNLYFGISF